MSKFNRPPAPRQPDTVTHQGGSGFSRDAKDELFLLGVANMVGEDTFYETGADRDARFVALIHEVTKADEKWARDFIGWLRSEANMRSAPIVAAVEYVRAGGSGGRQVAGSVLQRGDEPGEMVAYWLNTYGRKAMMPMPIKRGLADAARRLYNERNALRYDSGTGRVAVRMADVIDLVHPSPVGPWQSALFRFLLDKRHNRDFPGPPAILGTIVEDYHLTRLPVEQRRANLARAVEAGWSWERLAGWLPGGMDAQAWEAVWPNMGLMALARNLRNFDQAGVSDQTAHAITGKFLDPENVRASRQFPFRYLTAWKAVSSMRWGHALETALNLSVANVPALPGRTLILVDVSSSMHSASVSNRKDGRVDYSLVPLRWEAAAIFAGAVAQRAEGFDLWLFNTQPVGHINAFPAAESILRFAEGVRQHVGGGTAIMSSLWAVWKPGTYSRVIILTDEQTGYERIDWGRLVDQIRVPVYVWNLAGYKSGVVPRERNAHLLGGLSDASFRLIPLLENRQRGVWPWETPTETPVNPT